MSESPRRPKRIARLALHATETLIIGLGVVLLIVRLTLPFASSQGPALERWLSAHLGMQVAIGGLRGYWQGWTPELALAAVRLSPPAGASNESSSVRLARVRLTFDPLASIRALAPRVTAITLTGVAIAVIRDASGALELRGFGAADRTGIGAALPAALLGSARLRLEHTALIWIDRRDHHPPLVLTDGALEIASDGPHHRLTATLRLPKRYGGRVEIRARIEGNPLGPAWSGDIYLQARDARLAGAELLDLPRSARFGGSTIDFKVWSGWRAGRLVRAVGKYHVPKLEWMPENGPAVTIGTAAGGFQWSRIESGWMLVAGLNRDGARARARLMMTEATAQQPKRLRGRITGIALKDLATDIAALTRATDGSIPMLAHLQVDGELSTLEFGLRPDADWREGLRAVAQVRSASATNDDPQLRLSGVDARIETDGSRIAARVDSGELESTLGGFLSRPPNIRQLRGRITASWEDGERQIAFRAAKLSLDGNPLRAHVVLRWNTRGHGPSVTALLAMKDASVKSLAPYVPARGLHTGLATWLRDAAQGIGINDARLLLRSDDLDARSVVRGNASIDALAQLTVQRLTYTHGWPQLRNLKGTLEIRDLRAQAKIERGTVAGARITQTAVGIDNMARQPARLTLHGSVDGRSEQGIRYLSESPLAPRFSYVISELKPHGPATLVLDLSVPLKKGAHARATGSIRVADNGVELPGFAHGLTAVSADIAFDGNSFQVANANARYLDRMIVLDAEKAAGDVATTVLRLAGTADRNYLLRHLRNAGLLEGLDAGISPLLTTLRGESTWRAVIKLPAHGQPGSELAELRFTSELDGVRLDLPRPFTKRSDQRRQLVVENRFLADGVRTLKLRFGDAAAVLRLVPDRDGHRVERGRIRLGAATVTLPDTPGVVIEGQLAHLALNEWRRFLNGGESEASEAARLVRSVDLRVADLELLGYQFADTRLRATQSTKSWDLQVEARDIAGRIKIPADFEREPLRIDLDRLNLAATPDNSQSESRSAAPVRVDPRRVPAIDFSARRVVYASRDLGAARLVARRDPNGLRVERIYLVSPALEAEGRGLWTIKGDHEQSRLELGVHTEDLGALMAKLGYDDTGAQGGTADFQIDGHWPGPPADLSLERGTGSVTIRATKGRLVGVRRGASGRLFGLLSLAALPRRLLLDFNDLFEDGLRYNRLEGKFGIEGGNAYTSGLTIDGPLARIDISGRTGLVDQDYDETVTVTPKLSKSLPFAPVWLAEKLLRKKVFDRSFAYQYTVTGSWDDPVVAPVSDEPSAGDPSPDR